MTTLAVLASTVATIVSDTTTRFTVRATAQLGDAGRTVVADGIIATTNAQLDQLKVLIVSIGVVLAVVAFIIIAAKKGWAIGGIVQGLVVGGLIGFAVGGGGTAWLGNQFKDQLGS